MNVLKKRELSNLLLAHWYVLSKRELLAPPNIQYGNAGVTVWLALFYSFVWTAKLNFTSSSPLQPGHNFRAILFLYKSTIHASFFV